MQNHLTLSQLQKLVKATLDEAFALPVWVSAEIAEIKINYSGHCYLELVEKGGDNGVPLSQARAVIWRTAYARIAGYFEAETGQRLAAGIRILARVMISYHELYGFSLNILDIDPTFTLGDMERQRQITIERLQREGVWDINRENPLPQVVQRIAIVSSRQAAGYQDFCKELGKSPYAFSLTLFDAFMQGAGAEDSIVAALDAVADRMDDFDAVVLIRGGGSASDLNCFNAYRLCAHIAQFPLPILTGIGHDKDTSVADMVAHTALKTPTAVAGWLVERMTGVEGWLDTAALQLRDASAGIFRRHELRLAELGSEIAHQSALLLLRRNEQLTRWSDELSAAVGELLRRRLTEGVLMTGGSLTAAAAGLMLCFCEKPVFCLAAFALPGAGLSPVVPLLFSRAGRLDGVSSAAAASLISVLAYGGLLVVPPVIGLIAEQAGLEAALLTAPVLCAAVVAGSLLFRQK